MYEYEVVDKSTGEHTILCGKGYAQTMLKAGLNAANYTLIYTENVGGFEWL